MCNRYFKLHYENVHAIDIDVLEMQKLKLLLTNFDIFLIFAQNIDCGYTLEPPCRQFCSYEYPQSMFLIKNRTNKYTLVNPSFTT